MPYTVTKLLIWMILAFLLGILVGWALRTLRAKRDVATARGGATGAIERPATAESTRSGTVTVVEPPSEETVSEPVEAPADDTAAVVGVSPSVDTAAVVGVAPGGGVSDDMAHQREQMAEYLAELDEISAELDLPDDAAPADPPKASDAAPPE